MSDARATTIGQQILRTLQERASVASGLTPWPEDPPGWVRAIARLEHQTQSTPTEDPLIVRRGLFKFERMKEHQRLLLAKDLIRRTDPGVYEDPSYLAFLAFEAASIEMAAAALFGTDGPGRWTRFLLGTLHAPKVNAFARTLSGEDYAIILVHSSLVDFLYQAAKALVGAQNPARSTRPDATVSARGRRADILEFVRRDDTPVKRLYRTLQAYFYDGYPRAAGNERVVDEHHPPLGVLTALAERWTLAHEYGHVLGRSLKTPLPVVADEAWSQELAADQLATILTVESAWTLDHLPPEFALGSAVFVIACSGILKEAFALLGGTRTEQAGEHPPDEARVRGIMDTFYGCFEASYSQNRLLDMTFKATGRTRADASDTVREQIDHALEHADGVCAIWECVRPLLCKEHAGGRRLHQMWVAGP